MVIGLTGGIASGKTVVSHSLMGLGLTVIDADDIGREIMAKGGTVTQEIARMFGEEVLREGGDIDRVKLGRIIFSDRERRRTLERILHPPIQAEMWRRVRESRGDVVLDVPLLIETGEHEKTDLVLLVYATREVQVQRLMYRDGISRDDAITKIGTQLALEEKVAYADYIINNNGSMEETEEQVQRFWQVIIRGKETL